VIADLVCQSAITDLHSTVRNHQRANVPRTVAKQLMGHRTDEMYGRCCFWGKTTLRVLWRGTGTVEMIHLPLTVS